MVRGLNLGAGILSFIVAYQFISLLAKSQQHMIRNAIFIIIAAVIGLINFYIAFK